MKKFIQINAKYKLLGLLIFVLLFAAKTFAAIDANKSFSPSTVYPGQTSRLNITLLNSSLYPAINASLTDVFPNDVFISATPNISSTCGGTVATNNTLTNGEVSLSGGTVPAGDGTNPGRCSIQVDVYSPKKGTYVNDIPAGAVTAVTNGNPEATIQNTQGTLAIILQDLSGTMTFDTGTYIQGGETTFMRIKLTNPNPIPLTNVSFLNSLYDTGYNIRAIDDGSQSTTCSGGTITITPRPARTSAVGPTSDISLSGGTIPANGSCEVIIKVEPTRNPNLPYYNLSLNNSIAANNVTTAEGATNIAAISTSLYSRSGVYITKTFNNSATAQINRQSTSSANLQLTFTNTNILPVNNFSLTDIMPNLSPASGQMTVTSINSNTCGGTATNGSTQLGLTGGNLDANTVQTGSTLPSKSCQITATVSVDSSGSYINTIPANNLSGFQYAATSATLNVIDGVLSVTKSFSRNVYQGDSTILTITMQNLSTTASISNIDLTDNLNTMKAGSYVSPAYPKNYFRIGSANYTNTCGGIISAPLDQTTIQVQDVVLAPSQTCQATFTVRTSADAVAIGNHVNSIPVGNITFDLPGSPGQIYSLVPTATLNVAAGLRVAKSFSPTTIGTLGITRLSIQVTRYSIERSATTNLNLIDNLPSGYTVAPTPNLSNGCGGTLSAAAGSSTIQLTNGGLPAFTSGSTTNCYIYVNIKAPPLTAPNTSQTATNTIPADAHLAAVKNVSALDAGQSAPYNQLENYYAATASITTRATSVTTNIEFTPVTINGGGVSRVRISFSNIEPSAINLTGVGITDDFAGTDLRLYSNINPTFTDANGIPNSNGCRLGTFTGSPGGNSITLSGAQIDVGKVCYFEFNVTAYKGGNHINTLSAGDLISSEGVTNPSNVAATLTVGRQVNVGKGFSPSIIGVGEQSTLTLDFYNTNVAPNNETGGNPALIDTLPAGMQVVSGTLSTTCAGGVVSTGVNISGHHFVQLAGGTFPAENVCKVTAQVTTATTGVFINNIASGDLNTLSGAKNPDPTTATLRVIAKPTIAKSFGTVNIAQNGLSRITFTITNPNNSTVLPTGLTNVGFSDVLNNMAIATPLFVGGTCSGITHNAVNGGTNFTASGISIAPSGSCTVQLDVTSNVVGLHNNQTSGVTSSETVSAGNPSNIVQLRVLTPATITKVFNPSQITVGLPTELTFTLTNSNPVSVTINNPGFTDTFPGSPGQMVVAPTPGIDATCGMIIRNLNDTTAPVAGDVGILVRGGTIPANGSCTVKINVTAPVAGAYTNITSTLSTTAGISPAATANITVDAGIPNILLAKSCSNPSNCTAAPQLPGTELTYKINFSNVGDIGAQNLIIVDKIPDFTDYKIGTAAVNIGSTGLTAVIEYSNDYDPSNPAIATWDYTPTSGGGGAASGYDRHVKAVRWRVTSGILSNVVPNNIGDVIFITKIR